MKERIQKIIASSGYCSRRAAERLIAEGAVTVNGVKARLGDSATAGDLIKINGNRLAPPGELVYIMLNKPRGYVTTMSDEKGRKNVAELVSGAGARVYPVGRLDMDSEGLLIMTNDGALANRLMHPSHEAVKVYEVRVRGKDIPKSLETLRKPMVLDGTRITPVKAEIKKLEDESAILSIGVTQGINRQIRRMCAASGLEVLRLRRVSVGPLKLGSLKPGTWRNLLPEEIAKLQK